MKARSLVKITLLCLFPSLALLYFARFHWKGIVESALPGLEGMPAIRDSVIPERLAWTGIWISVSLYLLSVLGHFLSPDFSRKRRRPEMPALLRDLIRYGFFILATALVLRTIWGEEVAPLIGALGIGGVVLGFALQETLSNFFAGLALLAEQPFAQGDWIRIGDRAEGIVEHITWRATKIKTRDNDYQIFPNSTVAKEVIINFRMPSRVHAIRLQVGTSYDDSPDKVKRTLHDVLASVPEILRAPAPTVYLKDYAASSILFEAKCFIEDYEKRPMIEDRVMHRIWYAFRRADIEIPFPIQTSFEHHILPEQEPPKKNQVNLDRVLGLVPIFGALTQEELAKLAVASRVVDFGSGEPVIHQGDAGDTLFAIVMGKARVAVRGEDGTERTVAQLSPGEVFGEMSLLTGDPRTASVYAEDGLVLCSVSKEALLPVLSANPSVAEKIAEIVTLRKQGLDRAQAEAATSTTRSNEVQAATQNLLGRIRSFFRL